MGSGRRGLSGPRRCPLPYTAPFPLLAARSLAPFPVPPPKVGSRLRSWFWSSLRNVSSASLRIQLIAAAAAVVKERLFRSIPKIRLILPIVWIAPANRSRSQGMDRERARFSRCILRDGDLRPNTMRPWQIVSRNVVAEHKTWKQTRYIEEDVKWSIGVDLSHD